MKIKLLSFWSALISSVGIVELCCAIVGLCGVSICISPMSMFTMITVLTLIWWCVDGVFVSGFLLKRVEIRLPYMRTCINIYEGDLLTQEGCIVVPANDFFDNIVNETIVAEKSVDGQMIKRFWAGNTAAIDDAIDSQLRKEPFKLENRPPPGKNRRYNIGATVILKATDKMRVIWVALTNTDIATNKTHAGINELQTAIRASLIAARNNGNGDDISFPLIGGGLSRTGLSSAFLLDLLIGIIVDESKKENISETINIVLSRKVIRELNLIEIKRRWEN